MFGKEYHNKLDLLINSYKDLNPDRKKQLPNDSLSKKLYVKIFGIPEIGFQIRSMYFKQMCLSKKTNPSISRILDAGCGIGLHTFFLSKFFPTANVTGADIDQFKLSCCKKIKRELRIKNVSFEYMDLSKPSKKNNYDLILNIDVLEHIKNYKQAIRSIRRLMKTGGYLFIHVPQTNQRRIFKQLKNWHHDDHVREGISKQELIKFLKDSGFKIISTKETFGFFGKIAWELNHMSLSKNVVIAAIAFPLLYTIASLDILVKNRHGLGIAVLAQKKHD